MRVETTIPIPRNGIFWGIQKLMPPNIDGNIYYLWNPHDDDEYMNTFATLSDELAQFESEMQAIVSVWLVGFSYQQMLILFPEYKDVGGIRNRIFSTVSNLWAVEKELKAYPPRQLVDSEYLAIVKVVGVPAGKIHRQVYIDYMAWIQGGNAFWLHEKAGEGSTKLKVRVNKKKAKIQKLQDEIDELEEKLMATTVGY
jgi:hypothetical protein